jgi:CRISPR-associated protein Cas1
MCSPALMGGCAKAGVSISFLNPFGGFVASVVGFTPGNVLLRRQQFREADCESQSLVIAKQFITGKIANSRSVLLRGARDSKCDVAKVKLKKVAKQLGFDLQFVQQAKSLDQLRGQEGDAANKYFGCLNSMISQQLDDFRFTCRSRRPPLDRINALLSFLYSMLTHDARSACEATGLDAAVGFLHRDRPGRPSLALDLIEEFRSFLVDRLVLSLINRKQVSAKDFEIAGSGAVMLKDKPRKAVLTAYQKRKQDVITHPFLNEKTTIGLLIHLQARLLARHLRGDIDAYPPFVWR